MSSMTHEQTFQILSGKNIRAIKFGYIKKRQRHLHVRSRLRDWSEKTNKGILPPDRENHDDLLQSTTHPNDA